MNKLKSICQDIKEKTQGMSTPDKISYFWEYYRVETFFALFFIVVILSVGSTIVNNALNKPVLQVGVLQDVEITCSEKLDSMLAEAFPDAAGRNVPVRYSFSCPTDSSNMYASVQLAAYLSAGELDCGICDTDSLSYVQESARPLKVFDISSSALGQTMAQYGLKPLYYFYFEDTEHVDAARHFEDFVCR